jgi:hypothetical protein
MKAKLITLCAALAASFTLVSCPAPPPPPPVEVHHYHTVTPKPKPSTQPEDFRAVTPPHSYSQ